MRLRIALFGNFGSGNFGNECTLEAMIANVRKYAPDAAISCICPGPEETAASYDVSTFVIKEVTAASAQRGGRVTRAARRILIGTSMEIRRWASAIRILRNADLLVMTGTGMLGDFGIGPLGLHYDILRWSIAAKLCRCKLLFVSVGAGPIHSRLSRWFVKAALALADYRSYRDTFSKQYLEAIGFRSADDAVYPDLAFSLPAGVIAESGHSERRRPAVGVGLMSYYDRRSTADQGTAIYREYVEKLAMFVTWLHGRDYVVRILIGDAVYDQQVVADLRASLQRRGASDAVVVARMISPRDVLLELAASDIVVASRFHNVLLALLLNKPVVSLSYHQKVDALMAGFGLSGYCQDIEAFDVDRLIAQLTALEKDARILKPQIRHTADAYRRALDDQYHRILNLSEA
jgi:polysaccharide pyruvyl transferase WcaK-like protein